MTIKGNCLRNIVYLIAILVIGLIIYSLVIPMGAKTQTVSISQIAQDVIDKKVSELNVDQNQIIAKLNNGTEIQAYKESTATLKDYGITPELVTINVKNPDKGTFWPT